MYFIKQIRNGFTLVEVAIAVAVISIVGAVTAPTIMENLETAKNSKVEMNLVNLEKAF
ncbi:MAG: type II secretion system protein, partial [Candidatus Woesearchaeota archaeon]